MNLPCTGSLLSKYQISCPFSNASSYQRVSPGPRHMYPFCKKSRFKSEELLVPRPTPKQEDHSLSAVRCYLFSVFAVILHTGGRSSSRNFSTRHAVVTGTHLSRHTHIILTLTACLLQQRLQEGASLLRCTLIVCPVV